MTGVIGSIRQTSEDVCTFEKEQDLHVGLPYVATCKDFIADPAYPGGFSRGGIHRTPFLVTKKFDIFRFERRCIVRLWPITRGPT